MLGKLACYLSKILRKLDGKFSDCCQNFLGGISISICHFFCPSVCQSVDPSRTLFHEPYIMRSQFLVHMCKIKFFFFCFQGLREGGTDRKQLKIKNKSFISHALYLRNSAAYDHMIMSKMIIFSGFFPFFQNFCFLGCQQSKRAKNGPT